MSRPESSQDNSTISPTSVDATAAPTAATTCCLCGKPTDSYCISCEGTPGHRNTYYCREECRVRDRPRHVAFCLQMNTFRTLCRGGDCLQEIFYMYRAKLFDRLINKLDKSEEGDHVKLVMKEGKFVRQGNDLDYLHKLPCTLFGEKYQDDEDSENKDKRALLVHSASSQAIIWMHDLIEYFFADNGFKVSEQRIEPIQGNKSVELDSLNKHLNQPTAEHYVLVITLKNAAGTYVLDLCGAQYGFYDPITRFDRYNTRGIANGPLTSFDGTDSIRYNTESLCQKNTRVGALARINVQASQKLLSGAVGWEKEYGLRISTMLQARSNVYAHRREGLLHYLAYSVQKGLDKMARDAGVTLDTGARDL